jgi:hypothetical protein
MTDTPGKTIHDLALHERLQVDKGMGVIRTPHGWLYENDTGHMAEVPYDPAFKFADKEKRKDALRQLEDFEEGYGL